MSNWKVTAVLSSPLAGDAPYLDSLLEREIVLRHGIAQRITSNAPAPPIGSVHLPCLRGEFGGVNGIPRCSAPILVPQSVRHEHYTKRIAVENAALLRDDQRLVVATGNSWTKSYRLPNKVSNVDRVCWFIGGSKRQSLKTLLDSVRSIGKKVSQGYGRIYEWQFEEVEHDWSWFAPSEQGTLLMRVLPWCPEIHNLIGWKRWCGGVAPPYWHPDRIMEIAVPC
jgi:hypothetical protein